MMRKILIAASLTIALQSTAMAGAVIVYPAGGQSAEQQRSDEGECMSWAKEQTGFDPTAPMEATSPPPDYDEPNASAGRGALHGALGGLVVGAITGHPGRGAAIGAGTGALVGGVRRQDQTQQAYSEQDAWAQQQAAQYQESQNQFNRAYSTCLQGRGYTVN